MDDLASLDAAAVDDDDLIPDTDGNYPLLVAAADHGAMTTTPMPPEEALRRIVTTAVSHVLGASQGECREIEDRVVKWLDQAGYEVVRRDNQPSSPAARCAPLCAAGDALWWKHELPCPVRMAHDTQQLPPNAARPFQAAEVIATAVHKPLTGAATKICRHGSSCVAASVADDVILALYKAGFRVISDDCRCVCGAEISDPCAAGCPCGFCTGAATHEPAGWWEA